MNIFEVFLILLIAGFVRASQSDTMPGSKSDVILESNLKTMPESELEPKPESKLEPKPESKLEPKPESKLESMPDPMLDSMFNTMPDSMKVRGGNPFIQPSWGCQKIKGISGLPLTTMNVCDTRDACDIISPGGTCIHTSLDRGITSTLPALYPTMTCSSAMCSASSPPTGLPGVLQCTPTKVFGPLCDCPPLTTSAYLCGICASPASSTCWCCTG